MNNILKQLREKANLTQESVAERLRISVNTIQNWERTNRLAKESLHDLLDIYEVNEVTRNQVVLEIFGDSRYKESGDDCNSNFPEFLFAGRPDIVLAARRAVLTIEEMELFGYTYYVSVTNRTNGNYSGGPHCWPLEYAVFKNHGGYFRTMNLINGIEGRIGEYYNVSLSGIQREPGLSAVAYNYGLRNPGMPFSFCQLSKEKIANEVKNLPGLEGPQVDLGNLYEKCKALAEPVLVGTSEEDFLRNENIPGIIREMLHINGAYHWSSRSYELNLDEICSQCIVMEKREEEEIRYCQKKEQYLSDKAAYDKHPDLYDREPVFDPKYKYWLCLTELGKQYISWYES